MKLIIFIIYLFIVLNASVQAQLWFLNTTQSVLVLPNQTNDFNKIEEVIAESPQFGKLSVRNPRAAFFHFRNPHTQGQLFIDEIEVHNSDFSLVKYPKKPLIPNESGDIIFLYQGRENSVLTNDLKIQIRSKLLIEITNITTQILTIQIQTNQPTQERSFKIRR